MVGDKFIKVCGMRNGDNIRAVEALGVEYMGFIFFARSPRNVEQLPDYLPTNLRRVGVFVNEQEEVIAAKIEEFGLDTVQLHGSETPELCAALRSRGVEIFKAISVAGVEDLAVAERYDEVCDYFIFDTKCEGYGGSGVTFDWRVLDSYRGATPFLLSGGIGVESAEELREFHHPRLAGYDLNSRFESSAAVKDIALLEEFLEKLKQ